MESNRISIAILLVVILNTVMLIYHTMKVPQLAVPVGSETWSNDIDHRPWTREPQNVSEGKIGPRPDSGGKGTDIGRELYQERPKFGDPASKAFVKYNCGTGGTWCTVRFQARFTAEDGERLKIVLRGSGGRSIEAFIPNVVGTEFGITTGPRVFALSVPDCENCQIEFTIESGADNEIDSWASIQLLSSKCGSKNETNRPESTADGTLFDRFGRVLNPDFI